MVKKVIFVLLALSLLITACGFPIKENKYTCDSNAYNCDNFKTHKEAQKVFKLCGGLSNDIHNLDGDHDGKACETLP